MAEFWRISFPVPGQSELMAQSAEQQGWDGLFFPDTQCLSGDIYSAMCLAAKATQHLKVGTAVTNPVTRHPSVTASAIATVQVESNGRAVLGIGRGDSSLAYIGRKPAPVSTLKTYLDQLQRYLRGESVDIGGYASQNMWIQTTGQPKVPVEVAATGPRVISLGATMAERVTFALGANAPRIKSAMELAKTARAAAGLNPDDLSFGAYVNIACDDDIQRAQAMIRGSVGTFAHFTGMSDANSEGLPDAKIYQHIGANYDMANHGKNVAGHMQSVPDAFISRFAVTGNASYCVDRLGELIAVGLDRLVLLTGSRDANSDHLAASLERLASEVFPQLK